MKHASSPLLAAVNGWSAPAQATLWTCRTLFHDISNTAEIGELDETPKWGQPSWRPQKPRTGSTLRMGWSAATPNQISFFVDCKTDLAARMQDMYPDFLQNDGQRQMTLMLDAALPEQAIKHLAEITFRYHLNKRAGRLAG